MVCCDSLCGFMIMSAYTKKIVGKHLINGDKGEGGLKYLSALQHDFKLTKANCEVHIAICCSCKIACASIVKGVDYHE